MRARRTPVHPLDDTVDRRSGAHVLEVSFRRRTGGATTAHRQGGRSASHHALLWVALLGFLITALAPAPGASMSVAAQSGTEDDPAEPEPVMHLAGWSIGDWWRWEKVPTELSKDKAGGPIYQKVIGQELVNMGLWREDKHDDSQKRHQAWKTVLYANQTANSPYGPALLQTKQDRYLRVDDLALVQIDSQTFYGYQELPANNRAAHSISEYFPPRVEVAFPHAAGDQWQARSYPIVHTTSGCGGEGQMPCNSTQNNLHRYELIRQEDVTLTIDGKERVFEDAWMMVQHDLFRLDDATKPDEHRYQIWWYHEDACHVIKKEEYKADGTHIKSWFLRDFRCKGKEVSDPLYGLYSFQNYSSTRKHGELSVHADYERMMKSLRDQAASATAGGGGGFQIGESVPAPGMSLAMVALVGLAALVGRRMRVR